MKPLSDKIGVHQSPILKKEVRMLFETDVKDAVKRLKEVVEEMGVADISPYNVKIAIDDIFGEFK